MKKITRPSFSEEVLPAEINKITLEQRTDNHSFIDEECSLDLHLHEFFECTFTRMTFHGLMKRMEFADVIFDHCDFSNLDLQECVFRRVEFISCRLTGSDMSGCQFHDTLMNACQAGYLNCNTANLQNVSWQNCIFTEGAFMMMKIKNLEIEACDFSGSEWNDTKMNDLDFSDSIIDGILVNAENLKGIIVNPDQAVAMAKLLGIRVKS